MILLFPLVALIRFLLRNFEKKYTVWAWWIFLFRSICPVALSSALCMVPLWNRQYHRFLAQLGLTIHDSSGVLRSWKAVFLNDISVTGTFRICSIIWLLGAAGVLLFSIWNYNKIKKELNSAKELGDGVYETESVAEPFRSGFFGEKLYLPVGFQTKEMVWLLPHMEIHAKEKAIRIVVLFVMVIHWFNPVMWLYHYWWCQDMELYADDKTVDGKKENDRKAYAQALINFKRDVRKKSAGKAVFGGPFFIGIREEKTQKRARRMMFYRQKKRGDRMAALFLLFLLLFFLFLLRPVQMAWSGTVRNGSKVNQSQKENTLFAEKSSFVVAKMGTKSPEGLDWIVQLEMEEGTEKGNGYQGNFVLKVYDTLENEIASRKVANVFPDLEAGMQYFPITLTLCISDYNGDGTQELVLGQRTEPAEPEGAAETVTEAAEDEKKQYVSYSYVLINIGNKTLDVLCRDIIATDVESNLGESVPFEKPEGIDDIFVVQNRENKLYYVWNEKEQTYEKREMTEDDLNAHRENAEVIENTGEVQEHTLAKADGTEAVLVTTHTDASQSEVLQSVTVSPRGLPRKYTDVEGYYCDIKWLGEDERYAQLVYNGTKSQTFVLYDTKTKNVCYRHEDGTEQLSTVFKQYRESDITFEEGGAVVYELVEKNDDVLKINFAVEADNDITLKGSYHYNIVKKEASDLSYNRAVSEKEDEETKN